MRGSPSTSECRSLTFVHAHFLIETYGIGVGFEPDPFVATTPRDILGIEEEAPANPLPNESRVAITLLYWKDSLIGIPALMMLCGGDGIADIVGRRVPSTKLPWSPQNSVAGSLSVFAGGWLMTMLVFAAYIAFGTFSGPLTQLLLPVTWIARGAALVESLSFKDSDNLTVPLASLLIGHLVF